MEENNEGLHGTGAATARANSLVSSRYKSVKDFFTVRGTSEDSVKDMLKKKYDKDGNGVFDEGEVDHMMDDLMGFMSETKELRQNTLELSEDNSRLLRKVGKIMKFLTRHFTSESKKHLVDCPI